MLIPFVRLHQPSAFYGVGSRALGSNRIDESGFNKGYYELALGAEVTSYFERVMRERFLPPVEFTLFRCAIIWERPFSFASRVKCTRSSFGGSS